MLPKSDSIDRLRRAMNANPEAQESLESVEVCNFIFRYIGVDKAHLLSDNAWIALRDFNVRDFMVTNAHLNANVHKIKADMWDSLRYSHVRQALIEFPRLTEELLCLKIQDRKFYSEGIWHFLENSEIEDIHSILTIMSEKELAHLSDYAAQALLDKNVRKGLMNGNIRKEFLLDLEVFAFRKAVRDGYINRQGNVIAVGEELDEAMKFGYIDQNRKLNLRKFIQFIKDQFVLVAKYPALWKLINNGDVQIDQMLSLSSCTLIDLDEAVHEGSLFEAEKFNKAVFSSIINQEFMESEEYIPRPQIMHIYGMRDDFRSRMDVMDDVTAAAQWKAAAENYSSTSSMCIDPPPPLTLSLSLTLEDVSSEELERHTDSPLNTEERLRSESDSAPHDTSVQSSSSPQTKSSFAFFTTSSGHQYVDMQEIRTRGLSNGGS